MEPQQETIPRKFLRPGVSTGLFFLLFYAYVWLVVGPRLVHHALGILVPYAPFVFHTEWLFLREHLTRAGGLMEYCTRLLSQFYVLDWAGALIITATTWGMGFLSTGLLRRSRRKDGDLLRFVPAVIVLLLYGSYSLPLGPVLSILMAVGAFAVYVRLAPKAPARRVVTILIACPILYHVAGSSSLLFAVLVAIDEWLIGNRKWVAWAAIACGLVVPWLATIVYDINFEDAYAGFLLSAPGVVPLKWSYTLALYLFFPTALAGSVRWGNARAAEASLGEKAAIPASKSARRSRKGGRSPNREPRHLSLAQMPTWAVPAVFFGVAVVIAWFSLDTRTRTVLEMDDCAQHERWDEVLICAKRLPKESYSVRCNRNIMQALYHTGRLADEMFRYPQRPGFDLFSTPEDGWDLGTHFQESRLFLDLGQVNLALRCAYEALATSGEQPEVLEQLATLHAVKGQPKTARMLLHSLAKHPFHRQAAREKLYRLEADPSLAGDREISQLRENMPSRDSIFRENSVEEFLQILLEKNPRNRMAFELLMAHYLSNGKPEKVLENLPRLKEFAYSAVPRYYQEAIMVDALLSKRPPSSHGFEPSPEVLRRAQAFQRITSSAASPQEAFQAALEAGLGDSYFFYSIYGVSGR